MTWDLGETCCNYVTCFFFKNCMYTGLNFPRGIYLYTTCSISSSTDISLFHDLRELWSQVLSSYQQKLLIVKFRLHDYPVKKKIRIRKEKVRGARVSLWWGILSHHLGKSCSLHKAINLVSSFAAWRSLGVESVGSMTFLCSSYIRHETCPLKVKLSSFSLRALGTEQVLESYSQILEEIKRIQDLVQSTGR